MKRLPAADLFLERACELRAGLLAGGQSLLTLALGEHDGDRILIVVACDHRADEIRTAIRDATGLPCADWPRPVLQERLL